MERTNLWPISDGFWTENTHLIYTPKLIKIKNIPQLPVFKKSSCNMKMIGRA
jgi:hypothetical protein